MTGIGGARITTLACVIVVAGVEAQDVPMFRQDLAHTGVVERAPEGLGGVAWTFQTGGAVRAGPALVDGTLHVGSTDGVLYRLDAETGRLLGRFEAAAPILTTPAVADLVVFGDRSNTFYALRPNGTLAWTVRTGPDAPLPWGYEGWDYLAASPVIVDEVALLPSGDGTLYAVDLQSGSERWRFATGGRIRSTPAVVDGVAYFGSADGVVYGVSLALGREVWRFETDGVGYDAADFGFDRRQIQSSPAVVGGVLYVGSRDASLYAVDIASGEARWSLEDGSAWVVTSPAVREDTVWSARSSSQNVRAVRASTGEEIWVHRARGAVFSSPVVGGGSVFVGTGGGTLTALDAATGEPRWRFHADGAVWGTPVVTSERIYFGSDDGRVYALEGGGPAPRLAVYSDEAALDRSLGGSAHRDLARVDFLVARGYERLDTLGLARFMNERIRDRAPSVVVFSQDYLPADVLGEDPRRSLFRRYLEAGGKVVWPFLPPGILAFDDEGNVTGVERERASALLGVDVSPWNSDAYQVFLTDAGRTWGLARPGTGGPSVDPEGISETLALDELGRPAAWVRSYGGPPGSGFVYVQAFQGVRHVPVLRRVAEYGVLYPVG